MSESILEIMRNKGEYATMKELKKAGIHTRTVREALEKGLINKIKPGLYKLRDHQRNE